MDSIATTVIQIPDEPSHLLPVSMAGQISEHEFPRDMFQRFEIRFPEQFVVRTNQFVVCRFLVEYRIFADVAGHHGTCLQERFEIRLVRIIGTVAEDACTLQLDSVVFLQHLDVFRTIALVPFRERTEQRMPVHHDDVCFVHLDLIMRIEIRMTGISVGLQRSGVDGGDDRFVTLPEEIQNRSLEFVFQLVSEQYVFINSFPT